MMRILNATITAASIALTLNMGIIKNSLAQAGADVYTYPKAGQSTEKQNRDKLACHDWAVKETGYDPLNPPPAPRSDYSYSSPPPRSGGSFLGLGEGGMFGKDAGMMGDAGTGAALGAAGGAIAGSPGTGAAIGALAGTFIGGISRSSRESEERKWREQQRAEAQRRQRNYSQQQRRQTENYKRAYSACMTSRNYNVR